MENLYQRMFTYQDSNSVDLPGRVVHAQGRGEVDPETTGQRHHGSRVERIPFAKDEFAALQHQAGDEPGHVDDQGNCGNGGGVEFEGHLKNSFYF